MNKFSPDDLRCWTNEAIRRYRNSLLWSDYGNVRETVVHSYLASNIAQSGFRTRIEVAQKDIENWTVRHTRHLGKSGLGGVDIVWGDDKSRILGLLEVKRIGSKMQPDTLGIQKDVTRLISIVKNSCQEDMLAYIVIVIGSGHKAQTPEQITAALMRWRKKPGNFVLSIDESAQTIEPADNFAWGTLIADAMHYPLRTSLT